MTDIRYWLGLSLVPEIGPIISKKLLSSMGSPEQIFSAGIDDLRSVDGLNRERAENINKFDLWDDIEKKVEVIEKEDIQVITYADPLYPELLKEIPDAPVVLYMKGDYCQEDRFAVAIVGSRNYSHYGEAVTQRITDKLASAGFTVISGMARGIDTLAHKSALDSGGRTVAVLGSGLDICYPAENKVLMRRIISSGCVFSEFLPGTRPNRENFPRRNRLISGLSLGVLVVEAARESGSLITAHCALEQNREVFSVPGNIMSRTSEGTNRLIKQGAKLVLDADDIIEDLAPLLKGFIKRDSRKKAVDMTEEEGRLCMNLSHEPKHVDVLSRETGLPPHTILNLLLSMELKGLAKQSHGKRFYLS
jgi:DNA processing protein